MVFYIINNIILLYFSELQGYLFHFLDVMQVSQIQNI